MLSLRIVTGLGIDGVLHILIKIRNIMDLPFRNKFRRFHCDALADFGYKPAGFRCIAVK